MTLANIVKSHRLYIDELKKHLLKSAHKTRRSLKNSLQKKEIDLGRIQAGEKCEDEWRIETEIKKDYLETLEGSGVIKTFKTGVMESYGAEYIIAKISFFPQKLIDYFVDEEKSIKNVKYSKDQTWCFLKFGKTRPIKIAKLETQPGHFLKLFFGIKASGGRNINDVFDDIASKKRSRSKGFERVIEKNAQIIVIKNTVREINRVLGKANKKQKIKCNFDQHLVWMEIVER